jgi:hypothetical protein
MLCLLTALLFQANIELDQFIEELRSDDIAARELAQKGVEQLGADVLPALKEQIESETEPEVKARLSECLTLIEGRFFQHKIEEMWGKGDLDGALKQLALWEGAHDSALHAAARKQYVREELQTLWDPPGGRVGCQWFRPLEYWVNRLQVDRRWIIAVLLEWATDEEKDHRRNHSTHYLIEEGASVTPILIPLLRQRETFTRKMACILLGNTRDRRAVPELDRVCRDPQERPDVLKFGREAYQKCACCEPPSR